jgi:hypothetical protein
MTPRRLIDIPHGDADIHSWVVDHLGDLCAPATSDAAEFTGPAAVIRGGQSAAYSALQAYDVGGYARRRNNVWPATTRGSSLSAPVCQPRLGVDPQGEGARGGDVAAVRGGESDLIPPGQQPPDIAERSLDRYFHHRPVTRFLVVFDAT